MLEQEVEMVYLWDSSLWPWYSAGGGTFFLCEYLRTAWYSTHGKAKHDAI
jgi:hypothetical protein